MKQTFSDKGNLRESGGMRKVEFEIVHEYLSAKEHGFVKGQIVKGFFHGFFQEGNVSEGLVVFALIELENGKMYKSLQEKLKFITE